MKKNVLGLIKCFVFKGLKKNQLSYFLMLGLTSTLFFSCQKKDLGSLDVRSPKTQDKLSLCISSDVCSLDPRYGVDEISSQVIKMLFEGLMYIDDSGRVQYALAHSHELSPDKKTYIFHLKDCQWSNGMNITAYDFEYTWKSIIDFKQNSRSMAAHNFYVIKNVRQYLKSECSLDDVGVHALDAKTLQIELENPVPYFLESLSIPWFFPVCKLVDQLTPNWSRDKGSSFVCNGPFKLKEHRYNNEVSIEKNAFFWDAKNVQLKDISISVIKDTMTRLCLFEKKQINWIGKPLAGLPLDAYISLKKENKLKTIPSLGVYWYFFNTEKFPFNNKKLRQAFSYALNRKEVTSYILQSEEVPATGVLPPAFDLEGKGYFTDNDSEKAKALFEEALVEMGIKKENLPEITISFNTDEIIKNVAQIIQYQIATVLGVKVKLRDAEWKIHFNNIAQGDFCIGGMRWQSYVHDPMYILQTFRFKNDGINMSRWDNHLYQEVLDAADKEIDLAKRKELLCIAQRILMDEMPVIPVYFTSIAFAKSDNLQNVVMQDNMLVDFRHAFFKEPLK